MKYAIATLGCKVNSYESNVIKDMLDNEGYNEVSFSNVADIYIINTCTVTNNADSKSYKTIRQAIKKNDKAIIIAIGCLIQSTQEKVNEIDGVDIILGNQNKTKIVDYIKQFLENKEKFMDVTDVSKIEFEKMELNNSDKTRAFIKIQDGCNNYCSYCIIPYVRGNVRSKETADIIEEVNKLVEDGHKEFVLTGIHTGSYGVDIDTNLTELVKDLIKIDGVKRIRISSIEATEITDELLDIMLTNKKLANHMHIPIQSGSNEILEQMNRKYTKEEFINRINEIRNVNPDILITTDLIVGFPGETEELFQETIATLKQIRFHKIHVFPYSKRSGTEASKMKNQIDNSHKKRRVREVLDLSKKIEAEDLSLLVGKTLDVIVEREKEGYLIGHASNYSLVHAKGDEKLVGELIKVKINKVELPICYGTIE